MNEHQEFITDSLDTPEPKWISILSKFAGTCVECHGVIDQGDSILWNKKNGAKHKTCPAISDNLSNDNGIVVIDDNNDTPKVWRDPKKYSYTEIQSMNKCQCCGADVSNKSKRYIDDDRLVCVNHFG